MTSQNAENEQMDGKEKEHTTIKQHMTVCYKIWQSRNLASEYLRGYICFQEELIVKQKEYGIIALQ